MGCLSREDFKKAVFSRDNALCVCCKKPAVDAHHIIDRSLWSDGGYHLDNGVSLCSEDHLKSEMTLISCDELRKKAGITSLCYPEHFYLDEKYDHWGNIVLSSGMRIKGELFDFENVQKILKKAGVLNLFLKYVKFPRTYHLSDSPNLQNDDRQHPNEDFFKEKYIVASLKLDGEGTSMYDDYIHARSIDSLHHESQSWVKALHGRIKSDIFPGYRICGENMYARHSIHYNHLEDYFYVHSIWDGRNFCLPIKETLEMCELLNLRHAPIFYKGIWNRELVHEKFLQYPSLDDKEGYVVRVCEGFFYHEFRKSTAKWVRSGHVQKDDSHWRTKKAVPNLLKD